MWTVAWQVQKNINKKTNISFTKNAKKGLSIPDTLRYILQIKQNKYLRTYKSFVLGNCRASFEGVRFQKKSAL